MSRWPPWMIALRNQLAVARKAVEVGFQDPQVVVKMEESHGYGKELLKDRDSTLDTNGLAELELPSCWSTPMASRHMERWYIHPGEGVESRRDDSDVVLMSSAFCQPSIFTKKIEPSKGLSTPRVGTCVWSFTGMNTSKSCQQNF